MEQLFLRKQVIFFFFFSIHCCISLWCHPVCPLRWKHPIPRSSSASWNRVFAAVPLRCPRKSGRVGCLWSRSPRIYFSIRNKSAQIFSRRIHPEGGKHCRTCVRTGGGATNPHRFFSSFFLCARGIVWRLYKHSRKTLFFASYRWLIAIRMYSIPRGTSPLANNWFLIVMKSAALLQRATSAKTIASSSLTAKPNFMNESPWARWSAYRAGKRYFLNSKSSPFPLYRSKRCWYSVFILTIGYRCELNAVLLSPRRTFWSIRVGLLFFPILWGTYPKLWQLYSVSHYFVCTYTDGDSCRRHLILCSDTIIITNDIYKPFLDPFTGLAHCIEKQEKALINIQLGNVILELAVCRWRIRSPSFFPNLNCCGGSLNFSLFPQLDMAQNEQ